MELKKKEAEETAAMEKAIQQVEQNLTTTTVKFSCESSSLIDVFSYFSKKTCCGYSLEAPPQKASNEYDVSTAYVFT